MRIIQWIKEKIGVASESVAPTVAEEMRALTAELESEFGHEAECVLASISEEARGMEKLNLSIGRSEAIRDALECLLNFGEPEFAREIGREKFHLWATMARSGK